jgi:hypothetical protein
LQHDRLGNIVVQGHDQFIDLPGLTSAAPARRLSGGVCPSVRAQPG